MNSCSLDSSDLLSFAAAKFNSSFLRRLHPCWGNAQVFLQTMQAKAAELHESFMLKDTSRQRSGLRVFRLIRRNEDTMRASRPLASSLKSSETKPMRFPENIDPTD